MSPCNPEHQMNWVCTGRKVRSGVRSEVVDAIGDYSKIEDDGVISSEEYDGSKSQAKILIYVLWGGVGSQKLH